jgi:phosphatidylserine decarboxylase
MSFAREGTPFMVSGGALALLFWALYVQFAGLWLFAASGITVLAAFVFYFFRDPERVVPEDDSLLLAPGDGRIIDISEVDEETYGGMCRKISIFLSVFNVHVQRAPLSGEVVHFSYHPGEYLVAWDHKASERNERATLGIDSGSGRVLVRQIAGLIARRIVTYPREGQWVGRGERIGIIRFGSRVDLFFPLDWTLTCREGEKAKAGVTALAQCPSPSPEGGTA